jgi:threonine dehydrogenase-like Zn-dependent dehydrogenase
MADFARLVIETGPGTFEMDEAPVPDPGQDGAVLRLEACGVCGTDLEVLRGEVREAVYPLVPGHEPLGVVERIGASARRRRELREGDRVAVRSSLGCRRCSGCDGGGGCIEFGSDRLANYGFVDPALEPRLWGGFATHLYVPPQVQMTRIDAAIPTAEASFYNALSNGVHWVATAGVRPGERVVVLGPGARGLACVMAAVRAGADRVVVTGLERDARNLDLARILGADTALAVDAGTAAARVLDVLPRGADVVIDTTPSAPHSVNDAVRIARRGGRIILAGLKGHRAVPDFFTDDVSTKELTLRGVGSTPFGALIDAVRIIESRRFPVHLLATHAFALDRAEAAVLSLAGQDPATRPVHVHLALN